MKIIVPLALVLSLPLAFAAIADTPPPPHASNKPFLAERINSPEMLAAELASPYRFFVKYLEAPEQINLISVTIAKYSGDGKEPRLRPDGLSGGLNGQWRLAISVAVGPHELPKYDPHVDGGVPGTGSTYLGVGVLSHSVDGQSTEGTGISEIIQHQDIDMIRSEGPFDCAKLPFKIETQATLQDHAIPVFAWFPPGFEISLQGDKLTASNLPKGTVIVYAVVK